VEEAAGWAQHACELGVEAVGEHRRSAGEAGALGTRIGAVGEVDEQDHGQRQEAEAGGAQRPARSLADPAGDP
jgi:hypothetical protein